MLKKSFGPMIRTVLGLSRWGLYERIISSAVAKGYRVLPVRQYYDLLSSTGEAPAGQKFMVLRHDIDVLLFAPLRSLSIEHSHGVSGSYYFRWQTAEANVIRRVRELGGEVGFHHESLRYEMNRRGLTCREEITEEVLSTAAASLLRQIEAFESMFGAISSMASHGSPEHNKVKIRDVDIYERLPEAVKSRIVSAYYKPMLDSFDSYISDFGGASLWRYGMSPLEAIETGKERICFLSHPAHWDFSRASIFRRLSLRPGNSAK